MVSFFYGEYVVLFCGRLIIFGNVYEKNVVFLFDILGFMYYSLDVVKEYLLEIFFVCVIFGWDIMFNIIEFNEEVNKWVDWLVFCIFCIVSIVSEWIYKFICGILINIMEVLIEVYEDEGMDVIYLVIDGLFD